MECNKDEAIRAKSIAEKKMEENDFLGAQKIALKAQSLYPELENIGQLLSICDVHCSAQNRLLGSEMDWYGILHVEKLADELTIKKQYRRLALSLHPDKNRFPGAEGAFKLICEANTVLSDPIKKSVYDSKIRFFVKYGTVNQPSDHTRTSSQCNKQNNVYDGSSNLNPHQAAQSGSSVKLDVFWTACPYCGVRYQYLRQFIMKSLRCQTCSKVFVGHEISTQGASMDSKSGQSGAERKTSRPNLSQSAVPREKVAPYQGNLKTSFPNDKGPSASHAGSQGTTSGKDVQSKPGMWAGSSEGISSAPKVNVDLKSNKPDMHDGKSPGGVKEAEVSNGDAALKRNISGSKNKAKGKRLAESSKSYDFSSESELEDVSESIHDHSRRRSSRKRRYVSYSESDVDVLASLKRAQAAKENQEKTREDASDNKNTKHDNRGSFHNDAGCAKEVKAGEKDDKSAANTYEHKTDLQKDSSSTDGPEIYCLDPEFSDFEIVRDEKQFAVNQFWACFDTLDDMPRFYAKVKKVCRNPFRLIITWLEAVPIGNAFGRWVDKELPVGCGTFKFGQTDETPIRLSFSHQVHCKKGEKRGFLVIYPTVGEIWAIFKDWNINWVSEPENHKQEFKYEVVEVLSDFVADAGVKVCYLDKVGGFVSLFQRASKSEDNSFFIGPDELYKFSHLIPYFKMTGAEREGVPVGSVELDPAALPLKLEDLYYPSKAKLECINTASEPKKAVKNGKLYE